MRITALTPLRSGRIDVAVAGESVAALSVEFVASLGLHVGDEVAPALRDRILDEGANLATYDRAVRFLAARSRSVSELRRRLQQAKEEPARIERALARLIEQGFLDDTEYARQLARVKVQGQGVSRRRFRQELFKRGVAADAGDHALEELESEGGIDEAAAIERLVRKKARALASLDPATRQRRLWAFLARRGYESDAIRQALRRFEVNSED